ncbi:transposase [Streptomyces silvisoli]|uniref:Transposase n=1 Tax=Streptomyces silvisoli TaxID=3034235 RepID=A0ABT5ZX81_9ACTN|nr:transposase [Streptomyces silvisoli]MDF3294371.1 transposase [Streptomyces silvisoli]
MKRSCFGSWGSDGHQWERLEPLLPPIAKIGTAIPGSSACLDGMWWRPRTGSPWRDVPGRYGPWKTVYSTLRRWQIDGAWARILEELQVKADADGVSGQRSPGRCRSSKPSPSRHAVDPDTARRLTQAHTREPKKNRTVMSRTCDWLRPPNERDHNGSHQRGETRWPSTCCSSTTVALRPRSTTCQWRSGRRRRSRRTCST